MDNGEPGGARPSSTAERLGQLTLLLLFLFALSGGIALLVQQARPAGVEVTLPPASIQVHVTGAVASPGFYTLQEGDRLHDAIDRAGGASDNADLARVNLALRLQDGNEYHIPAFGEEATTASTPQAEASPLTNINRARLPELMALPGIGEVRAGAIIDYREENGDFQSVGDLVDVPGIGRTTVERIRPLVTVE